jgi:hypothetical protein
MKKINLLVILASCLVVIGCGKSEPWLNNPKKIELLKSGEDLTIAGKRLLGQKITSFGIAQDLDRSVYESGQIIVTSEFRKEGHPIFDVSHKCDAKSNFKLGALFEDLDCRKGTAKNLAELANQKNSQIKELCQPVRVDEAQEIQGYLNSSKSIYWLVSGEVYSAGIYKNEIGAGEFGMEVCNIQSREKWKLDEQEKQQKAQYAKDFPYYAYITCGFNGQHLNIMACFGGNVGTEIELRNGNEYGLYKIHQIPGLGRETRDGLLIDLRHNFELTAQNSSESLILGVNIYNRLTDEMTFQKQVSTYGVIAVKE